MNLKACCGLLTNKEDEDYDYDDVEQEPLPKPQMALETRKKVRGSSTAIIYLHSIPRSQKSQISAGGTLPSIAPILALFVSCASPSVP